MLFLIFFAIVGVVDSIKFIFFKILKISKNKIKNSDDAEFIIRNVANKNFWDKNQCKLIRIDNFDNETEKIVDIAKNNYDFLTFETKQTHTTK